MGRRRKKTIRITKRTLPKVFSCPQCGMISVRILRNPKEKSKIVCGSCGLRWEEAAISNRESIDVYNQFIDEFTMKRG